MEGFATRFAIGVALWLWASTAAAAPAFPLKVSTNGRYLVDQNSVPFRIQGDAGWDISTKVSLAELRTYLDNRQAKGFNTILVEMTNSVDYAAGTVGPAPGCKGASGALPFLKDVSGAAWTGTFTTADFSTPNDTYFAWIDTILSEAASRGMLILLTPMYLGYGNGASDGWWQDLNQAKNTQAVAYAFGQYLGNRYKGFTNVMWVEGGDMLPASGSEGEARAHKVMEGIQAAGDTHLETAHWIHENISTNEAAFASSMQVNSAYSHGPYPTIGPTYDMCRKAYQRAPVLPAYLIETTYEGEHGIALPQFRELMWGGALSCGDGAIMGNWPLWGYATGWQAAMDAGGSNDMQRLGALLDAVAWQDLVPSGLAGMKTLVTAGGGTYTSASAAGESGGDDWIVSAATPAGTLLVAYVPSTGTSARTFSVDMTAMSGASRARWYNPTTGAFTVIAASLANTGTNAFTTPGNNGGGANDWALVLEPSSATPDGGSGGSTGSGGASGTGGGTGAGGTVGTGGSAGAGGTVSTGSGGSKGTGGSTGSGGSVIAKPDASGVGGSTSATGEPTPADSGSEGTCGCSTVGARTGADALGLLLACASAFGSRRRRGQGGQGR